MPVAAVISMNNGWRASVRASRPTECALARTVGRSSRGNAHPPQSAKKADPIKIGRKLPMPAAETTAPPKKFIATNASDPHNLTRP